MIKVAVIIIPYNDEYVVAQTKDLRHIVYSFDVSDMITCYIRTLGLKIFRYSDQDRMEELLSDKPSKKELEPFTKNKGKKVHRETVTQYGHEVEYTFYTKL
jgi:hypothetical protein